MFSLEQETRPARHDIYLTAFVATTMLGIWMAWSKRRWGWAMALFGLARAFRTKGPVSRVMTILAAIVMAGLTFPLIWKLLGRAALPGLTRVVHALAAETAAARHAERVVLVRFDKS